MSSFKKVHIVPEQKLNSLQECAELTLESLERVLRISLLLAKVNAYNNDLQIRSQRGPFLIYSNIVYLIEKLEAGEHELVGETDFIQLLKEANIPIHFVKNENMKSRLSSLYSNELQKITPVSDYPSQQSITEYPSETDNRVSVIPSESSVEEAPVSNWRYHNYFVPEAPKKKRRSKTNIEWQQM